MERGRRERRQEGGKGEIENDKSGNKNKNKNKKDIPLRQHCYVQASGDGRGCEETRRFDSVNLVTQT